MMDKGVYRIIDANLNRLTEGLRVCEDVLRFSSEDEALTRAFKDLRHEISSAVKKIREEYLRELVSARDPEDIGIRSSESEKTRSDIVDLFFANSQRAKESLRVLEEVFKLFEGGLSQQFKKLRFKVYDLERASMKNFKFVIK